jgi:hypothetical protein
VIVYEHCIISLLYEYHNTKYSFLCLSIGCRLPYVPDSSMDALYEAVNKAWAGSFFNESKACVISARSAAVELKISGSATSGTSTKSGAKSGTAAGSSTSSGEEEFSSKPATMADRDRDRDRERDESDTAKRSPVVFNNSQLITADWSCPVCAAKIRLISISGG